LINMFDDNLYLILFYFNKFILFYFNKFILFYFNKFILFYFNKFISHSTILLTK